MFYELLAGLPIGQKEKLYLQEAETYFYLNQASKWLSSKRWVNRCSACSVFHK